MRAAEAVELALRQLAPDAVVRNLDVLELTNSTFRRLYGRLYVDLVNTAPHVLGLVYDMLDRPPSAQRKSDRLRLLIERLNLGRLLRLLRDDSWDVIVNTHFLPAEIIARSAAKARSIRPISRPRPTSRHIACGSISPATTTSRRPTREQPT